MGNKKLKARLNEDQRLLILQLLEEDVSFSHNNTVIRLALDDMGHAISHAKMLTQLDWLEEQDLITLERLSDDVVVAKLTNRGIDIATGKARVTGVARPKPE